MGSSGRGVQLSPVSTNSFRNVSGIPCPLRANAKSDPGIDSVSRPYGPDRRPRRSLRLKAYDYPRAGAYFVTVVVQGRPLLFGDVVDGEMRLNDAGKMAQRVWEEMPGRFPTIDTDAFVVMPNHIHGIIVVVVGAPLVGAQRSGMGADIGGDMGAGTDRDARAGIDRQAGADLPAGVGIEARATTRVAPTALGNGVGAYKSLTTMEYVRGVKTSNWPPFHGRLWQRNYCEHIVRYPGQPVAMALRLRESDGTKPKSAA